MGDIRITDRYMQLSTRDWRYPGNTMLDAGNRYESAIMAFDEANRHDPNRVPDQGTDRPAELVYAERMTRCLESYAPNAPEAVRLAARSQHICRWTIPRLEFPMDRKGYHQWRKRLASFHAEKAGKIMEETGYDSAAIENVQDLLKKNRLGTDPDAQLLEDVICLVFLEFYLDDFSRKHEEEKLVGILGKTWAKMSAQARQQALDIDLSPECRRLVERVVGQ
jgi:hypothetical protein